MASDAAAIVRKAERTTNTLFSYYRTHLGDLIPLVEGDMMELLEAARLVILQQSIHLELEGPIKVVGDIHGQFYDLVRIFKMSGIPPECNYLFLGNYVDRGGQGIETVILLACLKIRFPENFFLLRGRHEVASVNHRFGFFDECNDRYSRNLWKSFNDFFDCLPFAATIDGKGFAVHGGITPQLTTIDGIRKVSRPATIYDNGILTDILFSDPDFSETTWAENADRGVGWKYGVEEVKQFLETNRFSFIVRGSELKMRGFAALGKNEVITVFSAPKYCKKWENLAGVLCFDKKLSGSFQTLKLE